MNDKTLSAIIANIDSDYGDSWDAIVQVETGATYSGPFGCVDDAMWIDTGKGAVYFPLARIVTFRRDSSADVTE